MDKFLTELAEIMESALHLNPEEEQLRIITMFNLQLMITADNTLQENLEEWSLEEVQLYGWRNIKYGEINSALIDLKTKSVDKALIYKSIISATELFNSVKQENASSLMSADDKLRRKIFEDILVPHLVVLRFLKQQMLTR